MLWCCPCEVVVLFSCSMEVDWKNNCSASAPSDGQGSTLTGNLGEKKASVVAEDIRQIVLSGSTDYGEFVEYISHIIKLAVWLLQKIKVGVWQSCWSECLEIDSDCSILYPQNRWQLLNVAMLESETKHIFRVVSFLVIMSVLQKAEWKC